MGDDFSCGHYGNRRVGMGRPAKPTALLRLHGTMRPGRHGDRAREPKPAGGAPEAPEWLLPEARAEWDRVIAAYAELGILTRLDRGTLGIYCQMWARFAAAERADPYVPMPASYIATMANIATRLGLDPAGRTRLRSPEAPPDPDSPWDRLKAVPRAN